ncbi:MAG: alpha/beta fold hydrolase [Pseudobacteriovorax sp.]|nr:alpha/beta fold hydrolase [Pseudobacteriovorax sp.]
MKPIQRKFQNNVGDVFHAETWEPESPSDCLMIIHHGHGEYASRFNYFAELLKPLNIRIVAYDMRGHGHTSGKRGLIRDVGQLAEDLHFMVRELKNLYAPKKILFFGHSLGGATLARYLIDFPTPSEAVGAIFSAPLFKPILDFVQKLKEVMANALGGVLPNLVVATKLELKKLTAYEPSLKQIQEDQLLHDKISLSLAISVAKNYQYCLSKGSDIEIPILLFRGKKDDVISRAEIITFAKSCSSQSKAYHDVDGLHEPIHNDPKNVAPLIKTLSTFINDVTKNQPTKEETQKMSS